MFKTIEKNRTPKGLSVTDLQNISLKTPLYHPFLGVGYPLKIEINSIIIKYKEGVQCNYSTSGGVADGHFIHHLYLEPIEIKFKD